MDVPRELIDTLNGADRPVLVGHVAPDADALGSMVALGLALPAPEVSIALPGPPPGQRLRFLIDLAGDVPLADARRIAAADAFVVVDTAGTNRVNVPGGWDTIAGRPVVNIDHHITNTDFGTINWVVDHASSTCELVYELTAAAGWPLTASAASALYAGIYADTGAFSLPNASARVFEVAAALVRAGADVGRVGERLTRSQRPHEFDLIRTVYRNTRLAGDGHIAYSVLSFEDIRAAGCSAEDIDDQVSIPRSLSGIRVAILLSEGEQGVIRINLRGEDGTPVLPLAQKLGGGGHTFSAGARIRGPLADVVQRVLTEAEGMLHEMPTPNAMPPTVQRSVQGS